MLVAVYNENWMKDKNQIMVATSMFINERINIIERELGSVDENISSYKSENLLPDVQAASDFGYVSERKYEEPSGLCPHTPGKSGDKRKNK